jgi:predicted homoserine dehydrogenase-like protein
MPSNVELIGLAKDLAALQQSGAAVRLGLVGCGEMGTDIISRVAHMDGVRVAAIAELKPENAVRSVDIAYRSSGGSAAYASVATSQAAFNQAIDNNKIAITEDAMQVLDHPQIDVIIDATGVPTVGADVGMRAIDNGKHLVMMNVEADVTVGHYLRHQADLKGVVYSLGAGDEPSSCMELINFVSAMGHDVVCAGKGKNNPLNIDAIPDQYAEEAARRNMNPRMLVEFVDGSKTMVEMVAIANATGLVPDRPGMHGPGATLTELATTLIPEQDGGVLSRVGCVDYSVGKGVAPGVFVVADMRHERIRERMTDLKLGDGPYYTFHRPFHLTSLEVPLTCARAVLYKTADMQPLDRPVAEVCAVAKKDLSVGEHLDSIGEYCYRAWSMRYDEACVQNAAPCGLLYNAVVKAPIKKGELLTYDNVAVQTDSTLYELRCRQDAMWRTAETVSQPVTGSHA